MQQEAIDRPLSGIVVIDLVASPLAGIARTLRELGAEVIRLEPAGRGACPVGDPRAELAYWTANLGKRIETIAATELPARLTGADLVIEDLPEGSLDWDALRAANPALVHMTATGFGRGNAYAHWQWTDGVLHALTTELSRSGIKGRAPLLPPGEIALQCAIAQGTYVAMAALTQALVSGIGGPVDYAALDGAMQALDPAFGISGSATNGRPAASLPPGRPPKGVQYPIIPVADGYVRLCVLAPRQWQGMHRMMGSPTEFAGPEFNDIMVRFKSRELLAAMQAFLADKTRAEIEALGQQHGVPLAGLNTLPDCLAADHIKARGTFTEAELPGGRRVPVPNGMIVLDGERMGPIHSSAPAPRPAPAPAPVTVTVTTEPGRPLRRPLEGLKVLDLGVIVVGAETGRLLADLGADVVKIESAAFPDGSRQTWLKIGLSSSFGAGHRNKRSLGLNLKSDEGKALLRRMVADADVMLSNFKPGTLESLGLGYEDLVQINPRLIAVESSAFGRTGPWSKRMGYGPLVRAAAGLTAMWRYPDDPESLSDSVTIYPDHVCARIGASAVMALLARRRRTGRGGHVDVSQAEVMLAHLATEIAATALGLDAADGPAQVHAAKGEDEWCVVSLRDETDRQRLAGVIGTQPLADWLAERDPREAAEVLQAAGVPAAPMLRAAELEDHPYYAARGLFRSDPHDLLPEPMTAERRPAIWPAVPDADACPAPLMCQDTYAVMQDWLGLSEAECASLEAAGVLETTPAKIREMVATKSYLETAR
ncbi:CoA transferase [Novosphingobium sediminis]|uniref:CoA transferase n=1 Tax=Novosphingobium sediminis TaxID=707214 RepID=A0A512ANE0_9SPHN|nr:CoA transferase [Novosphingobium sediminis]GEO01225.1 CoA transferase [Novosphingobium sediminis]